MGGGASRKAWEQKFHLTSNLADQTEKSFRQVFPIWAIAVTSNQAQLAAATSDNRINLYCLVTKQLLIPLAGHADTIWDIAYSPDDRLLASSSSDGTVRMWSVATGALVTILPRNHATWVSCLAWSPDGTQLATGGADARVIIWDTTECPDLITRMDNMQMNTYQDPAWADAATAEAARAAKTAIKAQRHFQAHEKGIRGLAYAPGDPRMLVSVGGEGTIAVWDSKSGNLDCRLIGHLGGVNSVDVSPITSELIATGGEDQTVRMWDLRDIDPTSNIAKESREKTIGMNLAHFTLKGHEAGVTVVRFCTDGQLLASASSDCEVRIWNPNIQNPTLNVKFLAHHAEVRSIAWTVDQSLFFTAAGDGLVWAWQIPKRYRIKDRSYAQRRGAAKYQA